MLSSIIDENDIVYVYPTKGVSNKEICTSFVSRINNNKLYIDMPLSNGKYTKLPLKEVYILKIYTKTKGIITSDFKVDSYEKVSEIPSIVLVPASENILKIQRREFFRLDCALPIKFSYSQKTDDETRESLKVYNGIVIDIGGGGMKFVSPTNLDKNEIIQCVVALNKDYLILSAKVIDSIKTRNIKFPYQCRTSFMAIDSADREKIVHYIFDAHRKMLRKANGTQPD